MIWYLKICLKEFMKFLFYLTVLFFSLFAYADDTPSNYQQTPTWLTEARQAIKAKNYEAAIELLNKYSEQKNSADWNNLMGYTHRKKTSPDLLEAENYYQTALQIDPKHKGALEYYGELLLLKNDLAGAESLLKRLDKICTLSCEEFRDLKKSIQVYKSKK
jgi:tetratricopeptide (TPR) repeat protein